MSRPLFDRCENEACRDKSLAFSKVNVVFWPIADLRRRGCKLPRALTVNVSKRPKYDLQRKLLYVLKVL
jgi:hypothetical protein